MRDRDWRRSEAIEQVREGVWRHLTHLARGTDVALVAATLLQMRVDDVRRLAHVQFVLCDEVGRLLDEMPQLSRRLQTVTTNELEIADGRLRGAVRWGETYSRRAATGARHLYVTAPARRAYATPENELLTFALAAIAGVGRATGWHRRAPRELAGKVIHRIGEAERWLQSSPLIGLSQAPPSPKAFARVRTGRRRRDYATAIAVVERHRRLVQRLDRAAVIAAIQQHGYVTIDDPRLLELCCALDTMAALENVGWRPEPLAIVESGRIFRGARGEATLDVYYQHLPPLLRAGSRYREVQAAHGFARTSTLRPDLVLHEHGPGGERWLIVEAKQRSRSVESAARDALRDLLRYRRDLDHVLADSGEPYGLGYVWGEQVSSSQDSEIVLCSPDTLTAAVGAWSDRAGAG